MVITASTWACALAACLIGCGAHTAPGPAPLADDEITLYRDRALIRHRIEIVAPAAGTLTVPLQVAPGVAPSDLVVVDPARIVASLRVARAADEPARAPRDAAPIEPAGDPSESGPDEPVLAAPPAADPTPLELVIAAPRAGRFALSLGYATGRITWQAGYTLTANAAHDRAVLRGAVAIRNTTGLALRARTRVVDAPLSAWRDHTARQLAAALRGTGSDEAPPARPYDLGVVTLGDGETRVGLLAGDPPRRLRSVLVYDPIGTRLDHAAAIPTFDPALGASAASPRVTESFEVERGEPATRALPSGPVRLLERRA
ncbi:MAG TPA: hypothetical protein VFT22_10490, partial [Kofleriaceae bacterium]|nr:hypothetical protein [Kofleriaceae bacterium]